MSIVCLNGHYLKDEKAMISPLDSGFYYGHALYETMRTHKGRLLNLESHLKRLREGARLVRIPLPDSATLRNWLETVVKKNGLWKEGIESRVRLTVSGGVHAYDEPASTPTILIKVEPFVDVPPKQRVRGVAAITYEIDRPVPSVKSTNLIPVMQARAAMRRHRAYEVFLVNHRGYVTEGSVSNLFIVMRGQLVTPKAEMLGGTTRELVLEVARSRKTKVTFRDLKSSDLYEADEVFLCNTLRGILSVVKVDGRRIGSGKPGPVASTLWDGLQAAMESGI